MKRISQVMSLVLIISLLMSQLVLGEEVQWESAPVPTLISAPTDAPSPWAAWEVQMAGVYGLGNEMTYEGYQTEATALQLLAIEASFERTFKVNDVDKIDVDKAITRGDAVKELYDVISLVLNVEKEATLEVASEYFVANTIIRGRSEGNLALEENCTTQELIIFAKRAYDHTVYALGEDSKGCYWKVSDEDNTVYLLGSIHVTDGSAYPLSKVIMNDFVVADYLAVEANVLVLKPEDTAYIQQIVMLEGDVTLDQLISEENYAAYAEIVSAIGLTEEVYNKFKPWYAAILIQTLLMSEESLEGSMGIDVYFLAAATGWKPIIELESVKYQMDLFDSFSNELQESYLAGVLEGDTESIDAVKDMLAYWKDGNVDELAKMLVVDEDGDAVSAEFNEKLFTTRNANMLKQVQDMLIKDSENDYFVVVGAGHMVNETGIVQGLRDLGYEVELIN